MFGNLPTLLTFNDLTHLSNSYLRRQIIQKKRLCTAEPVQFCKMGLGGYQKIASLLLLCSQDPPIAETMYTVI